MTLSFVPSTIPYFRDALLRALAARAGLSGVAVCDGRPAPDVLASEEFVALMETEFEISPNAMQRATQPRQEDYTQHVFVSVVGATRDDQVTLGSRAFAIYAEILDQLRSTVHLEGFYTGAGQIASAVAGAGTYHPKADDMQREATLEFGIRVTARLQ